VTAGNQLMALVDTSSFWIAGYFKETQLPHIQVGQKARITLMGQGGQPFQAVVRSVGWGIFVADGAGSTSTALLPAVDQTIDWVRLPQRFPVRMQVAGPTPMPLRIGQTVSVAIIPEFETADAPKQPSLAGP
jgi:multidrug resistance efflux pump